jgi:hypothetical protein
VKQGYEGIIVAWGMFGVVLALIAVAKWLS